MFLIRIQEWLGNSIFLYPLILSLLSAGIFWIVFHLIPPRRQKYHIQNRVILLLNRILFHVMGVVQDSTNFQIEQLEIRYDKLEKDKITQFMQTVYMSSDLKHLRISRITGNNMTVGEAVVGHIDNIKKLSDELFRYIVLLDTRFIKIIDSIVSIEMNESFINSYDYKVNVSNKSDTIAFHLKGKEINLSHYAVYIFEYHLFYKELKSLVRKVYQKNYDVLDDKFFDYFYYRKDYKKSIKLAKILIQHAKKDYTATQDKKLNRAIRHILKAYLKSGNINKVKKIKSRYTKNGILSDIDFQNFFDGERYFSEEEKVQFDKL